MLKIIFSVLLALTATQARADGSFFSNFASCSGIIQSVPVTLDFFEEIGADGKATSQGYAVQTMGPAAGPNMKMLGKITVATSSDAAKKTVAMYAVLEPSVLFAQFDIGMQEKGSVEIFARGFGAVWGKFDCSPVTLGGM